MENYVMKNLLMKLLNEMNRENGYKEATKFQRNEITMNKVTYEQLKQIAFEKACTLVHIDNELYKDIQAIEIIDKAENYVYIEK